LPEKKAAFLDALKGLEAVRKSTCQFDSENNVIVKCSEVENELYRLGTEEKRKKTFIEWLKK
jgi:hypothetical protein